ncbi:unnamed protein product [Ilex paraguariensis]|uniref:Uncharacterized protein n=1 Tax=Ilex paraguariensis TaxID=185542 RepID=A0ABC8SYL6_9AQUA
MINMSISRFNLYGKSVGGDGILCEFFKIWAALLLYRDVRRFCWHYVCQLTFLHAGQEAPAKAEPKFNPFTGAGRRLDGKPLNYQPPPVSSSGSKGKQPDVSNGGRQPSAGSSSQSATSQSKGKLVFGSNANRSQGTQKEAAKETKQEQPQKKEEPKFQPFSGKKYSLKG